jgi:lysozyme
MQRFLVTLVALGMVAFILAAPSAAAKPRPKPTPTPRPTPTATATPTPTPTPTATPASPFIDGIDVSYHQGSIDWQRVSAAGKRFAFVRATAGTLTADSAYWANVSGARSAGITLGSYHFANPDTAANDAANEASWFLRNATIASGDLLPVLDFETTNGLGAAALTSWAQTWLTNVTAATGVRPIIYTTPSFWTNSLANTDWFARNGYTVLWIAHWTTASQPTLPAGGWGGNGWTFWQHSDTGSVPGIVGDVDLDRFNGSALGSSVLVP